LDYWNHNSAYHPMIVKVAQRLHGDVLDVGCGEGLLVERLAKVSRSVTGIDRDELAIGQAEVRTAKLTNARVTKADFMTMEVAPESYDLVTFVAAMHHMDLEAALGRAHQLLRPRGRLVVVGLSANKSAYDYARSALLFPAIRLVGATHGATHSVQVAVLPPRESFSEIRQAARRQLPRSHLRRALYYRYVLHWEKPSEFPARDDAG
jgi:2-polyprenyl-3-methyl-5-hydroxy-6-metoxy-1,4-benzoquinol methylase